jgi:hypothetical protein
VARRCSSAAAISLAPLRNCRSPCRKISGLNYRRAKDGERTARIGGDRKGRRGPSDRITVEATAKAPGLGQFRDAAIIPVMRYNTCI